MAGPVLPVLLLSIPLVWFSYLNSEAKPVVPSHARIDLPPTPGALSVDPRIRVSKKRIPSRALVIPGAHDVSWEVDQPKLGEPLPESGPEREFLENWFSILDRLEGPSPEFSAADLETAKELCQEDFGLGCYLQFELEKLRSPSWKLPLEAYLALYRGVSLGSGDCRAALAEAHLEGSWLPPSLDQVQALLGTRLLRGNLHVLVVSPDDKIYLDISEGTIPPVLDLALLLERPGLGLLTFEPTHSSKLDQRWKERLGLSVHGYEPRFQEVEEKGRRPGGLTPELGLEVEHLGRNERIAWNPSGKARLDELLRLRGVQELEPIFARLFEPAVRARILEPLQGQSLPKVWLRLRLIRDPFEILPEDRIWIPRPAVLRPKSRDDLGRIRANPGVSENFPIQEWVEYHQPVYNQTLDFDEMARRRGIASYKLPGHNRGRFANFPVQDRVLRDGELAPRIEVLASNFLPSNHRQREGQTWPGMPPVESPAYFFEHLRCEVLSLREGRRLRTPSSDPIFFWSRLPADSLVRPEEAFRRAWIPWRLGRDEPEVFSPTVLTAGYFPPFSKEPSMRDLLQRRKEVDQERPWSDFHLSALGFHAPSVFQFLGRLERLAPGRAGILRVWASDQESKEIHLAGFLRMYLEVYPEQREPLRSLVEDWAARRWPGESLQPQDFEEFLNEPGSFELDSRRSYEFQTLWSRVLRPDAPPPPRGDPSPRPVPIVFRP